MAFTASVLLVPGEKYNTLTSSDSGFFYGIAREIDASDGMVEKYSLSHAPTGKEVGLIHQGQPLVLVMLYRSLHAVNPDIELMDVARYWGPFFFALTLIPIFLIGRELAGNWGGFTSAFFMSVLGSSIYWAKVGSFDREVIQLFLGAWTIFLVIRMFKVRGLVALKFGILAGLVYGLFGLSWGRGFLYLSPVIFGGVGLVLVHDFLKKLLGGSEGSIEGKVWATILKNKFLICSTVATFGTAILVMVGLGGESPLFWTGFVQMVLGYIGIGGGGVTWHSTYASEMVKPGDLSKTFSKFYTSDFLTYIILILLALALIKILWSRRRWELLVFPWLVVLIALVWPGAGQARFERLWWPMVPVLAGVGVAALVFLFRHFSFELALQEWVRPLHKPVLLAFCAVLLMTPFIQNAYAIAEKTTPPTEWHARGLDAAFMEAFNWLDNTPENTVISIQWSFGHLLTGALGRPTVTDGAETTAEVGTWENKEGIIKPPDYIYVVRGNTRYIYGLDLPVTPYRINGRRIDVARLPTMDENEFEWLVSTYRDEYNCRIDYMIFSYDEYYNAQQSYQRRYQDEIANKLWEAKTLASIKSPHLWRYEGDNTWVFDFGENRENVVLDLGAQNVYLRAGDTRKYLDSYAILIVDNSGDLLGFGAYYPYSKPDIRETLVINITQRGALTSARLIEPASQLVAEIKAPISIGMAVFDPMYQGNIPEFLKLVYTSSNGLVKVIKVYHSPRLVSPANGGVENDNTPTFSWARSVGGVRYELAVDNDEDFSSPEVSAVTENLFYTPTASLPDENYFWRVRAFNIDNRSLGWSSSWTFTIDTCPPIAPTLNLPENNGVIENSTPTFAWSRPELEGSYTIAIDNDPNFLSPVLERGWLRDNVYTLTRKEALANGKYYWRVRFTDRAGNPSSWSENFTFVVHAPPGRPILHLPADNSIDNDSTPYFEWEKGLSTDNYRLLVDNENTFSLPLVDNVLLGATVDNWTKPDPGYADGSYWWKVIAINPYGENESSTWTLTIDTQPPGEPALVSPADGITLSDNTPVLEWIAGENASNHRLLVDNDADLSSPEVNILLGATDNTYTVLDESPLQDGSYYWRVIAIDRAGNRNESSVWMFVVST